MAQVTEGGGNPGVLIPAHDTVTGHLYLGRQGSVLLFSLEVHFFKHSAASSSFPPGSRSQGFDFSTGNVREFVVGGPRFRDADRAGWDPAEPGREVQTGAPGSLGGKALKVTWMGDG